jgi:hypothetical protein
MTLGYVTRMFSGTTTTSGNTQSSPINVKYVQEGSFLLKVTAASGSSPTLDITIQTYNSLTETWHTLATFDQVLAVSQDEGFVEYGMGEQLALSYVVGGSNPSFTWTLDVILK